MRWGRSYLAPTYCSHVRQSHPVRHKKQTQGASRLHPTLVHGNSKFLPLKNNSCPIQPFGRGSSSLPQSYALRKPARHDHWSSPLNVRRMVSLSDPPITWRHGRPSDLADSWDPCPSQPPPGIPKPSTILAGPRRLGRRKGGQGSECSHKRPGSVREGPWVAGSVQTQLRHPQPALEEGAATGTVSECGRLGVSPLKLGLWGWASLIFEAPQTRAEVYVVL